jgi:hypothetical protein
MVKKGLLEWYIILPIRKIFARYSGGCLNKKMKTKAAPTLANVAISLIRYSSNPVLDKEAFVKWAVFNFLIGNGDAQGKNL